MRKLLVISALLLFAGIAFGQTLNKGGILWVHEWQVTVDDATAKQMQEYWEKNLIPLANKHFPEAETYIVKGIGADNQNAIGSAWYYKSMDDLRKYFNEDGTPTEAGGVAFAEIMPMVEEMMAKFGEFSFVARDWIILK